MVLEATVLIIDNSEFARNGDFPKTRFESQLDSIEFIFQAKRNSNLENSIALLSSGSETPQILSTFTNEFGKLLSGLKQLSISNTKINLINSLEIASLILKHRQNKLQHMRIIQFICTPITEHINDLLNLAKKLKQQNIALDFINFGEIDHNTDILNQIIDTVNVPGEFESHLLTVRANNSRLLYENIATSPIILDESSMINSEFNNAAGSGGMDQGFMDFGVDPSMDPELAMALRLSMEEEQQRQERLRQEEQGENNTDNTNNNDNENTEENK